MKKLSLFIIVLFALTGVANAQWEQVGEQIILPDGTYLFRRLAMDINSEGVPYIFYSPKIDNIPTPTVKKFNGSTWEQVGNDVPTDYDKCQNVRLVIDSQDNIYIAYEEIINGSGTYIGYAYVKKLVDDEWVEIAKREIYY